MSKGGRNEKRSLVVDWLFFFLKVPALRWNLQGISLSELERTSRRLFIENCRKGSEKMQEDNVEMPLVMVHGVAGKK